METHPKGARSGTLHKLIPHVVSFMAGGLVLAALLGGYVVDNKSVGKPALEALARSLGYDAFHDTGIDKLALVRAVPGNFVRDVDMPRIVLDIKFEHWQKILDKRNGALASGILIQQAGDFVPAGIRYSDGKTTRTARANCGSRATGSTICKAKSGRFASEPRVRTNSSACAGSLCRNRKPARFSWRRCSCR